MPPIYTIKDAFHENRVFLARVVSIFVLILLLTAGLFVRLVYLQVAGHEHYANLAKDNRIKISPLPPTRGIIYDRKGKILAENLPSYSLELIPEQVPDMDKTLARLQKLLNIPPETVEQFRIQQKRQKRFSSIPLLMRLSKAEVAKFAVVRPYFQGVDIHARLIRHYPNPELTSHVVGYVGRINEAELKELPASSYRGTHHVGKTGVEKTYEAELHGQAGYAEIETNAQSRPINTLNSIEPTPGATLYLSLDIELQETAYTALESHNGAVAALEIPSGNVLVLVSKPGFDPNLFVSGISKDQYQALQVSDDQPLFNRAIRGQYPPGSTVKPFIALAGLEYQVTGYKNRLYCPGYYKLPNVSHKYRDWKTWGHGTVTMNDAIIQSCDVYFYDLALALGIDRMHEFMKNFGFDRKTGIDLVGEKSGLFPSREWKKRARNQSWFPGETLITGIGQGFTQVTPLQLARATATLANRGNVVTPVLVDRIIHHNFTKKGDNKPDRSLNLNPQNVDNIIKSMINVVHGDRGTARSIAAGIPYQIAGKTGTAQVFSVKQEEKYNEAEIEFKLRDHALFIAFAPADDPKIAIAVIAEHGGHGGSVAAPIAGKVIKQYLSQYFADE
ncbi:MAG: penicillin-binding protein 2 [Gammaproteobacteria bacterium]